MELSTTAFYKAGGHPWRPADIRADQSNRVNVAAIAFLCNQLWFPTYWENSPFNEADWALLWAGIRPICNRSLTNCFPPLPEGHEQALSSASGGLTWSIANPTHRLRRRATLEPELTDIDDDALTWRHTQITAEIVSAYVSHNAVQPTAVPQLLQNVFQALGSIAAPKAEVAEQQQPAIPIRKSVTPDFIVCLEDGKQFKSLKRHLQAVYGMTPEQYRRKWALPKAYPMVAPNYAATRSALAKSIGLGRSPGVTKRTTKSFAK
jgi:predicted transcriptional regulator